LLDSNLHQQHLENNGLFSKAFFALSWPKEVHS